MPMKSPLNNQRALLIYSLALNTASPPTLRLVTGTQLLVRYQSCHELEYGHVGSYFCC